MPVLDIDAVLDQLPLIGLISRDQYREARAEAEDDSSDAIIRSLMRKGWVTSWQLERLKKGDASSFFFGEYKALFHLAEGTFARVYRGERNDNRAPVAIKVLRNRFATSAEAVSAFHKEAEAGMRLRHENIVRIIDSGQIGDRHFMVMEYVEGSNLRELLRLRTRFKGREALPLMMGLAEGMTYSHGQGVTHRDIKATNILISNSGAAKLVDFGLAAIDALGGGKGGMQSQRTVDYSALERTCGSAKGDPRSDIFFLGCVFYHMLTGHVAMEDSESKDPLKKMLKRSFGVIKPISEHAHAPDPALSRIIEKMMRVDLASRYQTMADVAADFRTWRDALEGNAPVVEKAASEEDSLDDLLKLDSSIFQYSHRDEPEPEPEPEAEPATGAAVPGAFESKPEPETGTVLEPEPETAPATEAESAAPSADQEPEPARTTILCVEAQAEIQDALRKGLSRLGYRVLLISDAEVAVERYRESPTDVVLFDCDGQNASEALPALTAIHEKAEEEMRPLWALVLLGPRQAALREKLPKADRMVVLSKPVKMKQVQEALADLILGE